MVPFGGWEMPLHYGSQIEEHHATRRDCGLFDVSHMGEVEVRGAGALALVQEIVARDISTLKDGEEGYTVLCRDDGGLVDDLIVTRWAADHFLIVVNAATYDGDVAFMGEIATKSGIKDSELIPCSEKYGMIAVQGPNWKKVCGAVLGAGAWEGLKPYRAIRLQHKGADIIFSSTGYTGEPGCELLCSPEMAPRLWNELVAAGGRPCGLAARDTLRLEMGYCLSGQDFTSDNNPLEAGLSWVVNLDKKSFSGLESLKQVKARGVKQKLVGLLPEGRRIPRHENAITVSGYEIGHITSGGFSPSLNRPIALGYLEVGFALEGSMAEIELGGGSTTKATIVKPPFYRASKM